MFHRKATLLGALVAALLCSGCQTKPLGGTRWRVVDWIAEDRPEYSEIVMEFRPNGQLVTTQTAPDGAVTVDNRVRYSIRKDVITVSGVDGARRGMFQLDEDRLTIHTTDRIVRLESWPQAR